MNGAVAILIEPRGGQPARCEDVGRQTLDQPGQPLDPELDFERVHREHARVVHGIAVAVVGPRDADDAAQDAFVAIHRGLGSLRETSAVSAWVCRVARNACQDFLRRRRRMPTASAADVERLEARSSGAGDSELAERVLELVRGLGGAYRETLVLRLVEGLTGPEIAERTGMTPGSVRVNLCRGMATLRKLLEREGWP